MMGSRDGVDGVVNSLRRRKVNRAREGGKFERGREIFDEKRLKRKMMDIQKSFRKKNGKLIDFP